MALFIPKCKGLRPYYRTMNDVVSKFIEYVSPIDVPLNLPPTSATFSDTVATVGVFVRVGAREQGHIQQTLTTLT